MRLVLVLGVLLAASLAAAEDRLDALAASLNGSPEAKVLERMSRFTGVDVGVLQAERERSGLAWGDLFIAHRVASRGGHPVEKVLAARRTGAGWIEIVEEAKVDPEALLGDARAAFGDSVAPAAGQAAAKPAGRAADKPSLKDRLLDFIKGAPAASSGDTGEKGERGPDPAREEIRDRMLRGGSRPGR